MGNNENNDKIEIKPVVPQKILKDDDDKTKTKDYKNDQYKIDRAKEIKRKEYNYSDGLDEEVNYNKEFFGFLTNRKVMSVVQVLAFACVCFVVYKSFYYGNRVSQYEKFFFEIDEKTEDEVRAYAGEELDNSTMKKVAASELVSCLGSKVDMDNLPDSVKNAIRDIKNYYSQSYNNFAFAYKDIYTGFTVTYNENQDIFTASTIKAPANIYVYEMASQGKN